MPSCFTRSSEDDEFHDSKSQTSGKVTTFGQVAVRFHNSPKRLEHWFENAQRDIASKTSATPKQRTDSGRLIILPAPRLHIAIHICGSRGDVQPFIPIAKLLQAPPHRHRVRICTHPAFKDFVESNGLEFFSIGGDPEALMAYMVKNPGLLPGRESIKAGDIAKRRKEMAEMFEGTWRSCIEAGNGMGPKTTAIDVDNTDSLFIADVIIANPPSMGHIHCAEKLGIPLHIVFTMPWSPTKTFHHPLAAMEYGDVDKSVANYFSFAIMELMTWQGLGDLINKFRTQTLKLEPISPLWGFQLLQRLRVPHSYLWSQTLIPKPPDWPAHLNVTGFSFLKLGSSYTPPDDLAAFLADGPPPVYIGFGSIVVADPLALTKLIFKAVELVGVRAIMSKGWGGMGTDDVPDNIYMIGNCPHDWLFQRVSCVVHHGGAGTTAAGIALGKPTVVVPFFGDQPFWGQMIAKAGAGPKPIAFKQMTPETLAASIKFALRDDVGIAVKEMAARIAEEDGAAETVRDFEQALRVDEMRCHVCPERLAVWRDKKTGAHLSGLAVAVLAEQKLIISKQLRLLRHRHWYIHEGAEFPIIGALAAVAGFFSTIVTNTSDYSERLKRRPADEHRPGTTKDILETNESNGLATGQGLSSAQMEKLAMRMAHKTYEGTFHDNINKEPRLRGPVRIQARIAAKEAEQGRARQVTMATVRYAGDLTKTSLRTPVAFFYNIANGFRNMPSYVITNERHRRRDEIVGLGSGLGVAGKEFTLGLYEAFSGLIRHPYLGAKNEGPLGFPKGIGRGVYGFGCHTMAAIWGVPGYTLKGIERALTKHRLTTLQAELYLIRLRQTNSDLQHASQEEKAQVLENWKQLQRHEE
ncbi:UDP-Glycosyltransferase/glycogen phosphorylase [Ophiobolus disseminans]|uniref:UDP-Glycosyltransferase/glycogen phosphorylase n=1 Tax=Ophiobolus disseminans TaxID=1469910 RepID=A0A6A6ZTI0_9PLEO|nr:UDP-Glycosyltransferase/glycogen phosphorylase [Ophiobolus disseminans]